MRSTIPLLLLLACAGAKPLQDGTGSHQDLSPQDASAEPGAPAEPAKRWPPSLRASVMLQCQEKLSDDTLCSCLTRELEVLSPDPDVEFTPDDIQTGLSACQQVRSSVGQL